jgi:hypothetical protein
MGSEPSSRSSWPNSRREKCASPIAGTIRRSGRGRGRRRGGHDPKDIELKPGDRLLFYIDGLVETRDRAGRFFELDHQVAAALALPDLGAAVKQTVRLLLEHSGDGPTDDVLLALGEPVDRV